MRSLDCVQPAAALTRPACWPWESGGNCLFESVWAVTPGSRLPELESGSGLPQSKVLLSDAHKKEPGFFGPGSGEGQ